MLGLNLVLFLTLFSVVLSKNSTNHEDKLQDNLELVLEYLDHPDDNLRRLIADSSARRSGEREYGISIAYSSDLITLKVAIDGLPDSKCRNQSLELLAGLLMNEKWALKMYDASAKSPTGLLFGSTFQMGNFDECLSIGNDKSSPFQGQYCLANVNLEKPTAYSRRFGSRDDIHWAICTPNSCSASQIEEFIGNLLKSSNMNATVRIPETLCHYEKPIEIETKDIVFVTVISFISFAMIMATIFHGYLHYFKEKHLAERSNYLIQAIISFSIARNVNKIFTVNEENEMGLEAIAGIRTFAMVIIFSCHSLMFISSGPIMNSDSYDEMLQQFQNAFLLNNPLFVDTFFVIGAFLFCRILLTELDKRKGKINVIPIYLFRYIRVTPSYLVVIAFYCTWFGKINRGPLWDYKMEIEKERCLESWWTNILYINNYVNTDKMCMFQSWYLSVDTQLFFLAPAIIYPLWRWRQIGEWILGAATIITAVIPFYITYTNQLDPTMMAYSKELYDITTNTYFKEAYIKTHMRANAYCVGLLTGYILYRIQSSSFKMTKTIVGVGWMVGTICGLAATYSISIFYQEDYKYNALDAALYNPLHRIAWGFSTGWLLIACATKNAGFIGKILSWKILVPISRLTFCAYLVNGIVELHAVGILRSPIHLTIFNLTMLSLLYTFETFVCALVLCVMFESPIHGIEKILLQAFGVKPRRSRSIAPSKNIESVHNEN